MVYKPKNHNAFTKKAKWIQGYPHCIPKPDKESKMYFEQLGDVIWIPERRYLDADYQGQ
jgi:hypothetical protein